jgi:hypothetical protein
VVPPVTGPDQVFWWGVSPGSAPDRVFWGEGPPVTAPDRFFFWVKKYPFKHTGDVTSLWFFGKEIVIIQMKGIRFERNVSLFGETRKVFSQVKRYLF